MHPLRPIDQIFLRTLFMIVVPMVFAEVRPGINSAAAAAGGSWR
jgi:Na+/H+-dicarboxylate symporter